MNRRAVAFAMILGIASSGSNPSDQTTAGYLEIDPEGKRIDAQLTAEYPEAEKLWAAAIQDRENDDPRCGEALRCRKAVALQASPMNEYMLAQALTRSPPPVPVDRADEAVRLTNAAF